MITCRQIVHEGFVEIFFSREIESLYGAKVLFSIDNGKSYQPCAIYRGKDADSLLDCSSWDWNEAVKFGNIKFNGKPWTLYWNLFLNNLHSHNGSVIIRIQILKEDQIETFESEIEINPSQSHYFQDWNNCVSEVDGWKVEQDCLTVEEGREVDPIAIEPGLTGFYKIFLGLPAGTFAARIKMSNEAYSYPFTASRFYPEFQLKVNKELSWKTVELKSDSTLEIGLIPTTVRHPELYPFGKISYIKFVPVTPPSHAIKVKVQDKKLALYFEPYSWAYIYSLDKRWKAEEALSMFKEMGADEIHTQVIRLGCKSYYHSAVAEHFKGQSAGDDDTYSPGPEKMVGSFDILREAIDICRELGLIHYANAGLSSCAPGTPFEEKISREHPEWRQENILRYNHPETREYAANIIREFVEWRTQGISIDCMRWPFYHTESDLLALFREFHKVITQAKADGKTPEKIPLTARIPAGDVTYFKAFEQLAKEGCVQCIIPSTLHMRKPIFSLKPYLKLKDYGCKVYGRIDGWKENLWSNTSTYLSPADIKNDITRYLKEGADGIFVYQADNHLASAFTRTIFMQ